MKNNFKRIEQLKSPKQVRELVSLIKEYDLIPITVGVGGQYKTFDEYALSGLHKGYNNEIVFLLKESSLEITTKWYDEQLRTTTYIFDLNCEEDSILKGQRCYAILQKYFKVPEASSYEISLVDKWFDWEKMKYACSASPYIGFNKRLNNQEFKDVYEYDLNSAYASVLSKKIPDIEHPHYYSMPTKVSKGQIGFLLDDNCTIVHPGDYADVIFDEIESPDKLKEFCSKYYEQKRNSTGMEKLDATAMLNYPIGYMQRKNPFLRAYIVHKCNEVIRSIKDKDTLCWNTDAIYSRTRREDLEIGNNIGQFKELKIDTFRMIDNTYQINDDIPTHRGVVKEYYKRFMKRNKRPFNLLTDTLSMEDKKCIYSFNFETLKLEKNR